jgi:hypothetical protein
MLGLSLLVPFALSKQIKISAPIASFLVGLLVVTFNSILYTRILTGFEKDEASAIISVIFSLGLILLPVGNYIFASMAFSTAFLFLGLSFILFFAILMRIFPSLKRMEERSI